jgi:hypothetical protein
MVSNILWTVVAMFLEGDQTSTESNQEALFPEGVQTNHETLFRSHVSRKLANQQTGPTRKHIVFIKTSVL